MGRHSAPDDDGDLLVAPEEEEVARPRPRPRHAAPGSDLVDTDVIDPEVVERIADAAPRNVVDADIVEDDEPLVPGLEPAPVAPPTASTGPIAEIAPPRPRPEPAPGTEVAQPSKRERPGRGDLRLLRESSSLRARCAAALVLPFALYTIVLVVIGRMDAYLFWVWIPAILAGVLFGAQLDSAHKASSASARTTRE